MKKSLLLVFVFLYSLCWGQSNMITISSTVPAEMTVCGTSKVFTITIYNPSPFLLADDTLKLEMPSGIVYQAGSISGTGVTEANISIPNKPVFLLPVIPLLTSLNISFTAAANCDVMAFTEGGGIIQNKIRVDYTANNTQNYDSQITPAYILKQPSLSITTITNQSYTGNIGDVFTRCITIINGGIGELSQFTLTDVHGSGIQITSVNKGAWVNSGANETIALTGADFAGIGNGDSLFDNGESITICETVHVLNCISVASAFEAYWGCGAQHCQSSVSNANVFFPNLIPNLVITPNNGTTNAPMNSCIGAGNASPQQLRIINNGLGNAANVLLNIFQSTTTGYQTNIGSNIDTSSFTIQTGIGGMPIHLAPASLHWNTSVLGCMAPNPQGKAVLTIPSIGHGDTVYVKWNTYSCCYNACTGIGQYFINGWRYSGSYSNICQGAYIIPETWGRGYSQIYGALSNNGSPSTLTSGQTGTFDFLFSTYINSLPAGPGAHWKLEFTVPPCLAYSDSSNFYILRNNGINKWYPALITVSGTLITAFFGGIPPWDLTQAEIKINLTVNCAGCGGTGAAGAVSVKTYYTPNNTCPCAVGVSCQSAPITVLCPVPCPEGMIFTYFEIKRSNYGKPDNNNDGLADGAGSLDFTKIKTDRAMFGDTLTSRFIGKVKTSLAHPSWLHCYVTSSLSNGNRVDSVDASLQIYRAGLLIASCTKIKAIRGGAGTTRTFKYDLSVGTLPCLAGYVYSDMDSVVFMPRYWVNSNIGNTAPLNCNAVNEFYLSNIANPVLASDKYQCSSYNGNISIIGYWFQNYGPDSYTVKSCDNIVVTQNYYLNFGPCCNNSAGGNLFPYEYRNWAHIKNFTVIMPHGYTFISARFNQTRTAGTLVSYTDPIALPHWVQGIIPGNPNSDTLTFPVEQYYQGYGGTLPLSDDGFYGTLEVTFRPSCKVTPTLSQGITHNWTFAPVTALTGAGSASPFLSVVNDFIIYQAPDLFIQSTLPSIAAPDNTASWDVCLSNTSNVSDALNTWLSCPVISGISIIQVKDLGTNLTVAPIGSIYRVGTVSAMATRCFRITASFISCSQDSIIAYAGWNCNAGYPLNLGSYPCVPKAITLKLTPLLPMLVVNITAPAAAVQLCDTALYTIDGVNVQVGTAYNLSLKAVLPIGVDIVPGSAFLSYPISNPYYSIPDPAFAGGTAWQWGISAASTAINNNGLKGILQSSLNSFKLKFKVVTNCGYTSGSTIAFNLNGEAACGLSTGQEVLLSSALGITGAANPYQTAVKLSTAYLSPCANNSTMRVSIQNQGPLAFTAADSIIVTLPAGVSFVSGTFSAIHNSPLIGVPSQITLNGNIYLKWKLPAGVAAGDSTVFDFGYKGDPEALTCEITQFDAETTSSTSVLCTSSGNNCGINIPTGTVSLSVFTYKAYLSLSNGHAAAVPNPPGGETVTVNLDVTNTGEAILSGANSTIQFYYDANGNGVYNTGDVFLAQGTLVVTNNSIVHYSASFNVPAGQGCSIIAIINTAVNPCVCYPSQLLMQIPLYSLGSDTILCSGETMVLNSPPETGYTYSWTPPAGLSNAAISNPVLTSSNLTNAPVAVNYILTTNRMGCISKDTVKITVKPRPVSNAGSDIVSCPSIVNGSIGAAATPGYTYSWFPGTGLSAVNVSNPAAALTNPGSVVYNVTTAYNGCASSDTVLVTVNPLPTAGISGTAAVCSGDPSPNIIFTGASGTAPYTFTYSINGVTQPPLTTISGNSIAMAAPAASAGTFTYSLINVQDASSTHCSQTQNGSAVITVNPLPTASIAGSISLCEGAAAPNVTLTGASGTAPYTFTYKINGGPDQTVTSSGNSAVLAAPAAVPGTFIYSLVSVSDASSAACSQSQSGSAVITVYPLPAAAIAGTALVCAGTLAPVITFTGSSGTSPYIFTYKINGVTQPVLVSAGSIAVITAAANTAGVFIYDLVSVEDSSPAGCSQLQSGSAVITVNPLPVAVISGTATVCNGAAPPNIVFIGSSGTAPYTFTYTINGGLNQTVTSVGNTADIAAPTAAPGLFTYSLVSVTDADAAHCSQPQSGNAVITVNPLPTAVIAGTTAVCENAPAPNIVFTGSSGTPPYTFSYKINGGTNQTVKTVSGNSIAIAVPTASAGVFTYSLMSVLDSSAAACSQVQGGNAVITVNPLPVAAISGTAAICKDDVKPNIVFTGSNGTAPYTITYTINGGINQTANTAAGNSVTVQAPTDSAGTFIYSLVSIQDAGSTACHQLQNGTAVITVNPLPTAVIRGTTQVCINDPSPNITFIGAGGTAPYTFAYTINGVLQPAITSIGDSAAVSVPTNPAGVFTYSLVSVQDGSAAGCSQTQTGSAVAAVNQLPTASISGTASVCKNAPSPYITLTGIIGTAPFLFTYSINGGPIQSISTTNGSSITLPVPTGTAEIITYTLLSVQDASMSICFQTQNNQSVITVNPLPTGTIQGTSAVCAGGPAQIITFTGAAGTAPYTFTYSINGITQPAITTVIGNSASVAAPANTAGTFIYALESIKDAGSTLCSNAAADTAVVTINPNPVVNFNMNDTSGCTPFTIHFNASGNNGGTYTWNFGDAASGSGSSITHTFANKGIYNVSVIVISAAGCTALAAGNVKITANPPPHADFSVKTNPAGSLYPLAAFTDLSTITISSWLWNFGDPSSISNSSTAQNPTHIFTDVTTYNVQLIVSNQYSCFDTAYADVTTDADVVFPNAFSPNLDLSSGGFYSLFDLSNDIFFPYTYGVADYKLEIFNRWGELIFVSADIKQGWDGYYKGKLCPQDVYIWKAYIKLNNAKTFNKSGDVTLLR